MNVVRSIVIFLILVLSGMDIAKASNFQKPNSQNSSESTETPQEKKSNVLMVFYDKLF